MLITHFLFVQIGSGTMNPAKLHQKKAPKKRREKDTRGNDQSRQPKRGGPQRGKEPLITELSPVT